MLFAAFAAEDPARFQLLFQHTAPGFVPSQESMTLARRALDDLGEVLTAAGVQDEADLDLWTAVLTGLASQQVSNDPGGDRWLRLVDIAVGRLLFGAPAHPARCLLRNGRCRRGRPRGASSEATAGDTARTAGAPAARSRERAEVGAM